MTKRSLLQVSLTALVVLNVLSGCYSNRNRTRPQCEIKKLNTIGIDSELGESEFLGDKLVTFGSINSLATDIHDNLYALDGSYMKISKFDSVGHLLRVLNLKKGRRQGEFVDPRDFGIGNDGSIYITDFATKKITVLDSIDQFLNQFALRFLPADIVVCNNRVLVTGFWLSYQGPIIQVYSTDGIFLSAFVQRPSKWGLIASTGNFDHMAVSTTGTIYYSFPCPYKILELDLNGKILSQSVETEVFQFDDPVSENGKITMKEGSRGLATLPSGHVINIVQSGYNWMIDIFTSNLSFIGQLNSKEFSLSALRLIVTDSKGGVYFSVDEPLPHIIKYKIIIKQSQVDT